MQLSFPIVESYNKGREIDMNRVFPESSDNTSSMKVLVLLALVVCAVAALPLEEREEVDKRFICNLDCLKNKILNPLMTLISHDATEQACEAACKAGIHHLVPIPLIDKACAPACKELQHLGKIHG